MKSNDRKNDQDNQFPNPNIPKNFTEKIPKTKETSQWLKAIDLRTKISP